MWDSAYSFPSALCQIVERSLLTCALVVSLVAWILPRTAKVYNSLRWAISAHVEEP